jgi:hypothetical protein
MALKQKQKQFNTNVFERNNDRYYESDDGDDEGSKRKEGKQKLEEL